MLRPGPPLPALAEVSSRRAPVAAAAAGDAQGLPGLALLRGGHRHQVEGLDNEDAVFVTRQHPLFDAVLMVADGMGGHPRPKEASEIAVRVAREVLWDRAQLERAGGIAQAMLAALQAAHAAVR